MPLSFSQSGTSSKSTVTYPSAITLALFLVPFRRAPMSHGGTLLFAASYASFAAEIFFASPVRVASAWAAFNSRQRFFSGVSVQIARKKASKVSSEIG